MTELEYQGQTTADLVRFVIARETARIVSHDPAARLQRDPEGVHQLRVGSRRLRSQFRVLAPVLRTKPSAALQRELLWIGGVAGHVRDSDALRMLLSPATDSETLYWEMLSSWLKERERAPKKRFQTALTSTRYREFLRSLTDAVVDPPVRSRFASLSPSVTLAGLAASSRSSFVQSVQELPTNPDNYALHRLRIAAKRSRYGLEVALLFSEENTAHDLERFTRIQESLGQLHDAVIALELLNAAPDATSDLARPLRDRLVRNAAENRLAWRDDADKLRSANK